MSYQKKKKSKLYSNSKLVIFGNLPKLRSSEGVMNDMTPKSMHDDLPLFIWYKY